MPNFISPIRNNQPIISVVVFNPNITFHEDPNTWGKNTFNALVDTGATKSVITSKVAQTLGLCPIGRKTIISASQRVQVNSYFATVGIPITEVNPIQGIMHTRFFPLEVTEMPNLAQNFDMLTGMDIIQQCLLVVHRDSLIFSF